MSNDDENQETYGFLKIYDNTVDYPTTEVKENLGYAVSGKLIMIGMILVNLFLAVFAGYIAWNSYSSDPIWLKASKTLLSSTFYPFFLCFIFLKFIVFQLP